MNWLKRLFGIHKKQCIDCRYWCNGGQGDKPQEWGTCLKDKPEYVLTTRPGQYCGFFVYMDNEFYFIKK